MVLVHVILLILSVALTLLFFVYGFNLLYLLSAAVSYRPPSLPPGPLPTPPVAIHLPVYNEKYVIRRVVEACVRMARVYGADRVRIVIIDDSDDDTVAEVDALVDEFARQGIRIQALRRGTRQGFKAGALQAALEQTSEDYIAIFDADFVPPADFLTRTVPHLVQDEQLAVVQGRWTHLNRDYNLLTRAIAIGIDVHFFIEQPGRYAAGCFLNFNGSGGVLRRKALIDAGGWQADTLAEDLDASYRMQMHGYRVLYLKDLECPGEVPPTVPSFRKQQARWACGSLRTARKNLPALTADQSLGIKRRVESAIHLTNYLVHPLMFLSFSLACLAVLSRADRVPILDAALAFPLGGHAAALAEVGILRNAIWGAVGSVIILGTVSAWVYPVVALRAQGMKVTRNLPSLLVLFLLGCGISLGNTIEAGKALLTSRDWAFQRTPKYAIEHRNGDWRGKAYQVPMDAEWFMELALVVIGLIAIWDAARYADYLVLPILVSYTAAYAFVVWLTFRQSRQERGR
jgi:hypothetical protein